MSLDSLLTVVGLLVAVYAILPRVRKLELSMRFSFFGWIILLSGFLFIIYLQFYQTFQVLGLTPNLNLARWKITPANASFITLAGTACMLGLYFYFRGLTKRNIFKFREFIEELVREQRFGEIATLLERYLIQLSKIYQSDFALSNLRKNLEQSTALPSLTKEDIDRLLKREDLQEKNWFDFRKIKERIKKRFCKILPTYDKQSKIAKEIIREITLKQTNVAGIINVRSYFAIEILKRDFYENEEFIDLYLRELMKDSRSILYHEIKNNQNISSRKLYELPEENKLLYYFFTNAKIAERYAVYRPVGEFLINRLDELYLSNRPDPYNNPMGDFHETTRWESELMIGIRFFDIMVTSALHQGVAWHMWLFYFTHFTKRVLKNISSNKKEIYELAEWPSRYHYFLYEMISCLRDWSTTIIHLPTPQENTKLEYVQAEHENNNIPKSAILALGDCIKMILLADYLSYEFKKYLMDIVYKGYFRLKECKHAQQYAKAYINSIICGGFSRMNQEENSYHQLLISTYNSYDTIPHKTEYTSELRQILIKNQEVL